MTPHRGSVLSFKQLFVECAFLSVPIPKVWERHLDLSCSSSVLLQSFSRPPQTNSTLETLFSTSRPLGNLLFYWPSLLCEGLFPSIVLGILGKIMKDQCSIRDLDVPGPSSPIIDLIGSLLGRFHSSKDKPFVSTLMHEICPYRVRAFAVGAFVCETLLYHYYNCLKQWLETPVRPLHQRSWQYIVRISVLDTDCDLM